MNINELRSAGYRFPYSPGSEYRDVYAPDGELLGINLFEHQAVMIAAIHHAANN
jgi:hypothetical protein